VAAVAAWLKATAGSVLASPGTLVHRDYSQPSAWPTHCNDVGRRVARIVARRSRNFSAASAISAIFRGIGAATARSAWRRIYGKEKVYGSIP
jgi:hypothetical protein